MTASSYGNDALSGLPMNIAIVGGGRAGKFFLELIRDNTFPYLAINLVGVCDINPQAEGLRMAKEMGIYTTDNFRDLFALKDLDSIIELTNSQKVLLELIKLRPRRVGVIEHNLSRLIRSYFTMDQRLKSAEHQATLEKMVSYFLIQQSNTAIVVLNTNFTIAEANEAYLKIVGKSKADVLGSYCYNTYYGLNAPCSSSQPTLKCPMLETLKTNKTAHVIHEFPVSKGHSAFGNIVTYPIKNQHGEIIKIIEIWHDITDEMALQWKKRSRDLKADLNKMVQEDRMISLGKLVASCVHEINNPIQGLLTFSDLMQKIMAEGKPSTEDLKKFNQYLTLMSHELERCGEIVSGLLSFSRETPLEYRTLDFNDVLEAVISLTRHKMKLQDIVLDIDIAPGAAMIRGDPNRLQQTMLNLVFNAIEAMPEGGRLHIVSRKDAAKKSLQIVVRDTGMGIPEEHLGHLFDPFFTTKKEGEGTGLGLSIVYGVIKNHSGKIDVKSTVGQGTVFTLSIPTL